MQFSENCGAAAAWRPGGGLAPRAGRNWPRCQWTGLDCPLFPRQSARLARLARLAVIGRIDDSRAPGWAARRLVAASALLVDQNTWGTPWLYQVSRLRFQEHFVRIYFFQTLSDSGSGQHFYFLFFLFFNKFNLGYSPINLTKFDKIFVCKSHDFAIPWAMVLIFLVGATCPKPWQFYLLDVYSRQTHLHTAAQCLHATKLDLPSEA